MAAQPGGATLAPDRTIRSFNRIFAGLRESFDLSRLDCGGVNLWPLVRLAGFYVHEQICDRVQRPPPAPPERGRMPSATAPLPPEPCADLGTAVLYGGREREPVDLLVLQSHRETAETPDGPAGGFRRNASAAAAAAGMHSAALVAHAPGLSVEPEPGCWHYAVRPARVSTAAEPAFVAAAVDICAQFNREALGDLLQPAHVVALALRLHALLPGCGAVLDRLAPRILFTNGAFSLEKMAMLAAARRRGILCVDHQHGMYGSRSETFISPLPSGAAGIDPSPHLAWVWSDWFAASYGGDPQLMPRLVGGCLLGGPTAAARADGGAEPVRTVLYLHQGLVSAYAPSAVRAVPQALLEAIAAAPPGWRWLVRLHPRWRGAAQDTEDRLRAALGPAAASIEVAMPTGATLAECLARSDVVCTGFSASACDAYDAGLPVVLHHPVGRDLFGPAIEDGRIGYAEGAEALVAALAGARRHRPLPFFVRYDPELAADAMRGLRARAVPQPPN